MTNVILSVFFVLTIIYIVPFLIYGLASVVAGLKSPEGASGTLSGQRADLKDRNSHRICAGLPFRPQFIEWTVDALCFPMVADVRHG